MKNISTKSYKGVRDFYPQDWMLQKWIFWKMASVAESYGYEQYNASPLEPSELYEAKSGEEIVTNETYNLVDRGGRRVTIRPEMTPTVARMVADRARELPKPIRWYSIPNLFRYERPQRGRLREHYQLNVDIFGSNSIYSDMEVLEIGYMVMKNLGASDESFVIRINNRKITQALFEKYLTDAAEIYAVSKIIDKRKKMDPESFESSLKEYLKEDTQSFIDDLSIKDISSISYASQQAINEISHIIESFKKHGVNNIIFDQTLMRGFDYYTGMVFEFFDTHPDNNRSLFGGGRYDDLLDIFGMEKMPAVGFGMGDVTARDFLETHGLLPDLASHTHVMIAAQNEHALSHAQKVAGMLRRSGINVELDFTMRKFDKILSSADKKRIPFFIAIGEHEVDSEKYQMKDLTTGEKYELSLDDIIAKLS